MLSRRTVLALAGTAVIGVGAASGFAITNAHWSAGDANAGARTMTPGEAHAAAEAGAVLLVDIRRPEEWQKTGVPEHAVLADMRREDFLQIVQTSRQSADQPIALICAGGVRSAHLTRALTEAGLTDVIDVPEGMLGSRAGPGWLERDLPVRKVN